MRHYLAAFSTVLLLAGSAGAILPPDASAREPQIRAYRQQVRDKYEERMVERRAEAVRAYEKTRADIFTPPWMRNGAQAELQSAGAVAGEAQNAKAAKRNHRFLISVVLLILIAGGAGWVRYATRRIDE
jgi:hypothetical protein